MVGVISDVGVISIEYGLLVVHLNNIIPVLHLICNLIIGQLNPQLAMHNSGLYIGLTPGL